LDPAVTTDDSLRHHPVVTAWYNRQNESWATTSSTRGCGWSTWWASLCRMGGGMGGRRPARLRWVKRLPCPDTPRGYAQHGSVPDPDRYTPGTAGKRTTFGRVELLPSTSCWRGALEWTSTTGPPATRSRVTHAFTRPDWYDVRVRAHWGGQVAEGPGELRPGCQGSVPLQPAGEDRPGGSSRAR